MVPTFRLDGIEEVEKYSENEHIVMLLFVKPSDENADLFIKQFHYLHVNSNRDFNIYAVGYSSNNNNLYEDYQKVQFLNDNYWYYSDTCFIENCKLLSDRLKSWEYIGEPELIILKNNKNRGSKSSLDFRNACFIDINYGIEQGYIDSFPRFMERLFRACKEETDPKDLIKSANRQRIKPKIILEKAIGYMPKLPESIKNILKDWLFYR